MYQTTFYLGTNGLDSIPGFVPTNKIAAIIGIADCLPTDVASFQYEPTLYIPTASRGQFLTRENDDSNPIFGFSNVRGRIPTNPADVNYSRLILDSADLVGGKVLSKPWINHKYYRFNDFPGDSAFNGHHWYVTLNLRRLDSLDIPDDSTGNDSTVILQIRLPYKDGGNFTSWIHFDSVPDNSHRDSISYYGFRGMSMRLKPNLNTGFYATRLQITKGMLPKAANGYRDITISAHFRCDDDTMHIHAGNPLLKLYNAPVEASNIDSLSIDVFYLSNHCPVALDWIRIENPVGRNLLMGRYDTTAIGGRVAIKSGVQEVLTKTGNSNTYKFFRLYGQGGDDSEVMWNWGAMRYVNGLVNGLLTSSIATEYPTHYRHYTRQRERWVGAIAPAKSLSGSIAAPYYRPSFSIDLSTMDNFDNRLADTTYGFGISGGYKGFLGYWNNAKEHESPCLGDTSIHYKYARNDSAVSGYETQLRDFEYGSDYCGQAEAAYLPANHESHILERLDTATDSKYISALNLHSDSYQGKIELQLYGAHQNKDVLYSNQPWWLQLFIVSNWNNRIQDPIRVTTSGAGCLRPPTGEETRLGQWLGLVMGAKGLIYDRQGSYYNLPDKSIYPDYLDQVAHLYPFTAIGVATNDSARLASISSSLTGINFLRHPNLGGDYLSTNEPTHINQYIDTTVLANYFGLPTDQIPLLRLSQRLEMRKTHDWIAKVQDTLLLLRLFAWNSKGFKLLSSQRSYFSAGIIDTFISQSKIRTRQLNNFAFEGSYAKNFRDSSFYELSLLQNKDTASVNKYSEFFVGVVNRRTDPLIRPFDTILLYDEGTPPYPVFIDSSMKFYTSAEFDSYTDNAGYLKHYDYTAPPQFRATSYWREKFWERQGCRELSVFFNDSVFDYANKALRITELGNSIGDSAGYYGWQWWKKNMYDNRIDKYLRPNQPLRLKLLPGQGKILKVRVLDSPPLTCDCNDVMPSEFVVFHRSMYDSSCYSLEFELYPCANLEIGQMQLRLDNIPSCFRKHYEMYVSKNGGVNEIYYDDITGLKDTLHLTTNIGTNAGKKIKFEFMLCPEGGLSGGGCTDADLRAMQAKLYFDDIDCEKKLRVAVQW